MKSRRQLTRVLTCICSGAMLAVLCVPASAQAAERKVLCEQFTATWCSWCPYVGEAHGQMIDQYPGTWVGFQIHCADAYAFTWGTQRKSYYTIGTYPTYMLDGIVREEGSEGTSVPANKALMISHMETRLAVPTDVSLELGGEKISGQTFRFVAKVTLDDTSAARTVRFYMIHAQDHYPTSAAHDRNCARQAADYVDLDLEPGVPQLVEHEFTFSSAYWDAKQNIRIIAWVQKKLTSKEIANAEMISYPFPVPPVDLPEDLTGDGTVDVLDLVTLLGFWGECDGCAADLNKDGVVDVVDLLTLIAAWS